MRRKVKNEPTFRAEQAGSSWTKESVRHSNCADICNPATILPISGERLQHSHKSLCCFRVTDVSAQVSDYPAGPTLPAM